MAILSTIICNVSSLTFSKVIDNFTYTINTGVVTKDIAVTKNPDCSKSIVYSFTVKKSGIV